MDEAKFKSGDRVALVGYESLGQPAPLVPTGVWGLAEVLFVDAEGIDVKITHTSDPRFKVGEVYHGLEEKDLVALDEPSFTALANGFEGAGYDGASDDGEVEELVVAPQLSLAQMMSEDVQRVLGAELRPERCEVAIEMLKAAQQYLEARRFVVSPWPTPAENLQRLSRVIGDIRDDSDDVP